MPVGVDRVSAERAKGPPGAHHFTCALGEGAGCPYWHPHQQHFGSLGPVLANGLVVWINIGIGEGIGLNHHLRRRWVPAQAHGTGPELLLNSLKRIVVDQLNGRAGGDAERVPFEGDELVENFIDLLGEQGRLLLLHGDAHQLRPRAYLQVERARTRSSDGADDDPIRPGKLVNKCRHVSILGEMACAAGLPCRTGVHGARK